jgi:hypothetical protein
VILSNLTDGKEMHLISTSLSMEKLTKIVVSFLKTQNQKLPPSKVRNSNSTEKNNQATVIQKIKFKKSCIHCRWRFWCEN